MSLGKLDITDREQDAPPDLLAAVSEIIARHTPVWQETDGLDGYYVCGDCWARLSDAEERTHVAYELWAAGYLQVP